VTNDVVGGEITAYRLLLRRLDVKAVVGMMLWMVTSIQHQQCERAQEIGICLVLLTGMTGLREQKHYSKL
jgi:hypothetical protein